MYAGYLISWLHPILVHFPIVLLLAAFVAEGIGWRFASRTWSRAAHGLLVAGCVISLFAFVSGNFSEVFAVRGGTPHAPVDAHGIWAMITTWCFLLLTVTRFFLDPMQKGWKFSLYLFGLLIASGFLIYTGHQGGKLVYDHGANVVAMHGTPALDMQDLRDLYQEQTQESIIYSEMMHHVFGWIVLCLSLFLIASKIWPDATRRAWQGGPYILLGAGCFLMIFSDTDSWPLSNARPIYDKEVFQHKIFAILLAGAGVISLMRRNQPLAGAPSSGYHLGLALLALVGGGLLFTHVHSVAPYSNRAVGVYLHHLVMGFVALSIGGISLWEAFCPEGMRWRSYLWPSILLVESVLLIFYNEDIPWFIRPLIHERSIVQHEESYRLRVDPVPVRSSANQVCQLRFVLEEEGKIVRSLEIVHEHPLHLMIVSKDLSFFDHIHPVLQSDGSLLLNYRFPHGGEFILFADLVPKGRKTQSFRLPMTVQGNVPPAQSISETAYKTIGIGTREVLLFTKPIILAPGQPSHLRFALYEKEKGISDLQLFLGCFGHCIIVSEDTSFYLHTHPEDHSHHAVAEKKAIVSNEPVMNAKDGLPIIGPQRQRMFLMGMTSPSMEFGGPEILFPATFPKSGLYKVWGQFQHRGEVLTASFVVRVP